MQVGALAAVALALGFALDSADGQLARLTGTGSPNGEWLDHITDCIKTYALHAAVLISWFRWFDIPDTALLIPIAFGFESSVFFFAIILTEQLRRGLRAHSPDEESPNPPKLRSILVLPADYGFLCLTFFTFGIQPTFFWLYTALAGANIVFFLGALPRWYRELKRLAGPSVAALS